jgi:hypothetical protein
MQRRFPFVELAMELVALRVGGVGASGSADRPHTLTIASRPMWRTSVRRRSTSFVLVGALGVRAAEIEARDFCHADS